MAAPRCARSFFGPAKRLKISAPRPYVQTFSRSKSSGADDFDDGVKEKDKGPKKPIEEMTLDEHLEDMGVEPAEYKKLWQSQREAEARFAKWEPKTEKEAKAMWKAMQDAPDHLTLLHAYKHGGVEPLKLAKERGLEIPSKPELDPKDQEALAAVREPLNIQAIKLRPLRRSPTHGIPVCDLQLRTYSIRNMMLFADFAMRAAYYMGLPARGPIPLPRITERWTVPRANFIFKKSQENFERITMRRLIQIQDGHPAVVKQWLAFLQKHQYYGVGMKANIWEYESLDEALNVGQEVKEGAFEGRREAPMLDKVQEILNRPGFKEAMQEHNAPQKLRA